LPVSNHTDDFVQEFFAGFDAGDATKFLNFKFHTRDRSSTAPAASPEGCRKLAGVGIPGSLDIRITRSGGALELLFSRTGIRDEFRRPCRGEFYPVFLTGDAIPG
jgi:hypothetical protein